MGKSGKIGRSGRIILSNICYYQLFRAVLILFFTTFVVLALPLDSVFCSSKVRLRLSSWVPPKSLVAQIIDEWIERVKKATDGELEIVHYYGGALGSYADHYNMVLTRRADIVLSGGHATVLLRMNVSALPMLYRSADQAGFVHWKLMEKFMMDTELKNVKPLFVISTPPDQLFTNKRRVEKLEDFRGMKLATGQVFGLKTLKVLGSAATFIPPGEMYVALERGLIDGLATNWEKAVAFKEFEVTTYRTEADLWVNIMPIFMNLEAWNRLPDRLKQSLEANSGGEFSRYAGILFQKGEREARELILRLDKERKRPEPYAVPEAERERWRELLATVYQEWTAELKDKGIEEGETILKEAFRLANEYR